jgi:DNA-binding XRE family transcriptional regulator
MTPKPLDFRKVEALRKHMLLTTSDMSELLKVSRMTYYGWVKGKPLR